MSYNSGVNSTEKLLDTIRGKDLKPELKPRVPKASQQTKTLNRSVKKKLAAGVVIGRSHVSLVLTGEGDVGGFKELVKWSHVPIPDMLDMEHERFPSFLKTTISEFLEGFKKADIWSVIDSKNLKLRNLTLPDLPDSKLPNAAFWGFKKEVDLDAKNEVFDFHLLGTLQQSGVQKKNVLAYSGLKSEITALRQVFESAGYPLKGVTAAPFALQNYMRSGMVSSGEGPVTMVKVDRFQTEITCFLRSAVQLVRTIRTGSHSLVEDLLEESGDLAEGSGDVLDILSSGFERDSAMFAHIEHGAERLVGKVVRTGDYCSMNYASSNPVEKYLFFGETDNCHAFMEYAADQIPADTGCFNPYESITLKGDSISIPEGARERSGLLPALGLSLSSWDETPNFLNTYVHRNTIAKYKKMNVAITSLCLICLMACFGCWWWQDSVIQAEASEKSRLEAQMVNFSPQINKVVLNNEIQGAKQRVETIKAYGDDYLSLAIISEICALTPEDITLESFESDLQKEVVEKKGKKGKEKKTRRSVTIKGTVSADYTSLESALTGFVVRLEDSPIFGDIMILKKKVEMFDEKSVLTFTADMEVL